MMCDIPRSGNERQRHARQWRVFICTQQAVMRNICVSCYRETILYTETRKLLFTLTFYFLWHVSFLFLLETCFSYLDIPRHFLLRIFLPYEVILRIMQMKQKRQNLPSTEPSGQCLPGSLSSKIRRPVCGADSLPQSSTVINNACNLPIRRHGVMCEPRKISFVPHTCLVYIQIY